MILPIIYINYLIYYFELNTLPFAIIFFIIFFGSIFLIIKFSKKIIIGRENNISYELKYNISSFLIFFIITFFYFKLYENGIIKFDFNFSIWSVFLGIFLVILHDAYFYFAHSILHTKFMMKYIHIVHHKSNPSNIWSSYNFHPVEALILAGASIIIFIVPINIYALLIAIFVNDYLTIMGHCGYETFNQKFKNNFLFKYFATATYHDTHHSHNNGNLSLYFTHLDKIFKTRSKDYEKNFENIKR